MGLFGGQRVFDANPNVEEALRGARPALAPRSVRASVPALLALPQPGDLPRHLAVVRPAWTATPAITGADGTTRTLRDAAQHAIDHEVKWIPAWGRDRIFNMVTNRPDWCISRQRAWGVPIPAVDCTACGEAILTTALVDKAAAVFEQYGADAWYERPIEEFLPDGFACPSCGGTSFERERDILDVWFDSGSSHEAVLPRSPELGWPADMYLEGSDQHRGWFQSSLLVALATRGRPPYREVLTHGFLIDLEGRKMSKSVGNAISPQEVIKESGAEIIRLWVAMTRVHRGAAGQQGNPHAGRRHVPEAAQHVPDSRRQPVRLRSGQPTWCRSTSSTRSTVTCWRASRTPRKRTLRAYDTYDFSTASQALSMLATVDLSAFYVDVTKDRMYTLRRAFPRAPVHADGDVPDCDGLARLIAPILPVTAEDLWRHMPGTAVGVNSSRRVSEGRPPAGTRRRRANGTA